MTKHLLAAVALSGLSMGALAYDVFPYETQKQVELKDGQILYVFEDGKMAVADRLGRPVALKRGAAVETKDGQKITVNTNEVYRLHPGSAEAG